MVHQLQGAAATEAQRTQYVSDLRTHAIDLIRDLNYMAHEVQRAADTLIGEAPIPVNDKLGAITPSEPPLETMPIQVLISKIEGAMSNLRQQINRL